MSLYWFAFKGQSILKSSDDLVFSLVLLMEMEACFTANQPSSYFLNISPLALNAKSNIGVRSINNYLINAILALNSM